MTICGDWPSLFPFSATSVINSSHSALIPFVNPIRPRPRSTHSTQSPVSSLSDPPPAHRWKYIPHFHVSFKYSHKSIWCSTYFSAAHIPLTLTIQNVFLLKDFYSRHVVHCPSRNWRPKLNREQVATCDLIPNRCATLHSATVYDCAATPTPQPWEKITAPRNVLKRDAINMYFCNTKINITKWLLHIVSFFMWGGIGEWGFGFKAHSFSHWAPGHCDVMTSTSASIFLWSQVLGGGLILVQEVETTQIEEFQRHHIGLKY